jgi:hypothetical protein
MPLCVCARLPTRFQLYDLGRANRLRPRLRHDLQVQVMLHLVLLSVVDRVWGQARQDSTRSGEIGARRAAAYTTGLRCWESGNRVAGRARTGAARTTTADAAATSRPP